MVRKAFFSFHYQKDVWRVNSVRNSWVTKPEHEASKFLDAAEREKVWRGGDAAIKQWIDNQLNGTSVTVVLIGSETAGREYVNYEIVQSHKQKKGLLGIYIHQLKDQNQRTSIKGRNPFDDWSITVDGRKKLLSEIYPTYDWVNNDGYNNMPVWIERAAQLAGR